jgi:protein ImuB
LPLQLLLRANPDWREKPVVVVDRDKPQGLILWANARALATRIHPGMRYAAGLGLSRELCGGVVPAVEVDAAVSEVTDRLWRFSPRIEPSAESPGVFWLDASGLRYLYPSLAAWAEALRDDLAEAGFRVVVAVGFSRFGSYAATRARRDNVVFATPEEEQAAARRVPMSRLGLAPPLVETLRKLGVETLGAFIGLPPAGIVRRFGAEAGELHRLARGEGWEALTPADLREPVVGERALEYPETNTERLLALLADMLPPLLSELSQRHEHLAALQIRLQLDNHERHEEEIAPATPTHDLRQILGLCRLRLERLALSSGVIEIQAEALGAAQHVQQETLFPEPAVERMEAAARALAKIRAEFGNKSVVRACLHEGHLPEAQYRWEVIDRLPAPRPTHPVQMPLIRRIYHPPRPIPGRNRHEPDGWLVAGIAEGPVEEVIGPQYITGGWWTREVVRAYYYVRTRSGRWLWIYHDQQRRRWFVQGEVE